jgi:hypothetical protein
MDSPVHQCAVCGEPWKSYPGDGALEVDGKWFCQTCWPARLTRPDTWRDALSGWVPILTLGIVLLPVLLGGLRLVFLVVALVSGKPDAWPGLVDDMSTIASGIGFRLPEVIVLVVIVILIGMTIAVGVLVFYGYRKLLRFLRT